MKNNFYLFLSFLFFQILLVTRVDAQSVGLSFPNGCAQVVTPGTSVQETCGIPQSNASASAQASGGAGSSTVSAGAQTTNGCNGSTLAGIGVNGLDCESSSQGGPSNGVSSAASTSVPGPAVYVDPCTAGAEYCP